MWVWHQKIVRDQHVYSFGMRQISRARMGITRVVQVPEYHQCRHHARDLLHLSVRVHCSQQRRTPVSQLCLCVCLMQARTLISSRHVPCIKIMNNLKPGISRKKSAANIRPFTIARFANIWSGTWIRYDTQAYGLTGVIAGFLIGFKQLVPEHLVTLWGVFSIRVKVSYNPPASMPSS